MPRRFPLLLLLLALCASVLLPPTMSRAASREAAGGSVHEVFAAILARWQRISSYTCLYHGRSITPEGENLLAARYFFARPEKVRMEIFEGPGAGTTLLWEGGPKVRARRSGIMKLFPASLELRN
ncbi:MAG: hypothetical protein HY900_18665, partial [Deltaproteobacteria bacterium]|nr:hypothetical protein [Deltaproteobacteria bacterium]